MTGPHMDQDLFERVAAELFPFAYRFQPSISGEPLMSKGLPFMLKEAQKYGVKTEICSNASLLNAKMREAIVPSLGKLIVSFDGATKETFEWVREGGVFEEVVENLKRISKDVKLIPLSERPIIGLACVLMRRNIEELPQLVELAWDIGVDFLATSHVHPVTDLMKGQSLVHDVDLAISCIDEAMVRAQEMGVTLLVQPLDQLIASTATSDDGFRSYSLSDGVVEGLGQKVVHLNELRQFPKFSQDAQNFEAIRDLRERAKKGAEFVSWPQGTEFESHGQNGSIWVCDFLWNKTYVALDGTVKACCVPGTPNLGKLEKQSFSEVWNSPAYTRMRESLVRKSPVPFCRGCQHIQEISVGAEMSQWIGDGLVPTGVDDRPLPHILDPTRARADDESEAPALGVEMDRSLGGGESFPDSYVSPPTLTWIPASHDENYVVEFSRDGFRTTEFATDWQGGGFIGEAKYRIPDWGWDLIPAGERIDWRVIGARGERDTWPELGSGSFRREEAFGA